jgi:DNA-directed RNA polymerase subunit RPC12/RpoP
MTFSHITAEYRCTKCPGTRSVHGNALSLLYVAVGFISAIAWAFVLLRAPWSLPWYYFFYVFAGELLALFIAGLPLSMFFIGGSIIHRCPNCRSPMILRGRHFTKSQKPLWTDFVLLLLFFALNVVVWVKLHHHV